MTSREAVREQLLCAEQMSQIRPREAPAKEARTVLLDRPRIVEERPIPEVQTAARHPQLPVPSHARRQDAVEEVDPALDRLEQVGRRGRGPSGSAAEDRRPAPGCRHRASRRARPVTRRRPGRRRRSRRTAGSRRTVRTPRGAPDRGHPARCRIAPGRCGNERPAALRPAMRSRRRICHDRQRRTRVDRLVEGHRHIEAEGLLHRRGVLRREAVDRAVEMRKPRNVTPSSSTTRRSPSDTTWNPPESVRMGRSQSMNRCSPPSRAIRSWPGRRYGW